MEQTFYLGEIKAVTFQSEKHSTNFSTTVKLYITHLQIEVLNKTTNILMVEDNKGNRYQVGVCPASTWKSYYHCKNGRGYRYMAGPYYIESLNIEGFENKDIPLL